MEVGKEAALGVRRLLKLLSVPVHVLLQHQEVQHLMEHRHHPAVRVGHLVLGLFGVNLKRLDPLPELPDLVVDLTQVGFEVLLEDFQSLCLRYLDLLNPVILRSEVLMWELAEAELDDCVEEAFSWAWLVACRLRQS